MATLMEFAIFPTDKGESVSEYVSQVIKLIDASSYPYQLTPMGTIVETETPAEALELVNQAYKVLEPNSKRVYASITLDIKKGKSNLIKNKIQSIEDRIGKVRT